jgi:rhamnulokinase
MNAGPAFVAIDLGAESGRVVVGRLAGGTVALEEVSRFPNRPEELPDGLHWNVLDLYRESLGGIGRAVQASAIRSVGVDSWGVDYGLLDERHRLLGLPFHYRDRRTQGLVDVAADRMMEAHAYEITGIQPMPINTVYQLLTEVGSAALTAAYRIAPIPDLLSFWLCGVLANETTAASTTGLLDARSCGWARGLIQGLGLPARIFGDLVEAGTVLGPLRNARGSALGLSGDVSVIATAGHDTAAAFAGVPSSGPGTAVLASGTWSLLGLELDAPVLSERARAAGLSNERGVFGTVRLLKNVMGLWLVQQCRAAWEAEGAPIGYDELVLLASSVEGEAPLFDPDEPSLAYPGDMPAKIAALLRASGQHLPEGRGGLVRSIFASLACKYRLVLEYLEQCAERSIDTIHVVGGGSHNTVLCRLTADITRRVVAAGPAEASALGNVLVQGCALGYVSGREEMREIACASVSVDRYAPAGDGSGPEATYRRFLAVTGLRPPGAAHEEEGRNT